MARALAACTCLQLTLTVFPSPSHLKTPLSSTDPGAQLDDVKQLLGLPFRPYLSGAPAPPNDEERVAWGKHLGIYDAPPDPEVSPALSRSLASLTATADCIARSTLVHKKLSQLVSTHALPVRCRAVGSIAWLSLMLDPHVRLRRGAVQVERIIQLMAKVFSMESCMLSLCADQRVWIRNARGFAPGAFEWRWCAHHGFISLNCAAGSRSSG